MTHTQGIRRRRDDSTALEIEELDSRTMRSNSYNCFQYNRTGSGPLWTPTIRSFIRRGPASSKKQRTLVEQLDELCVHDFSHGRNRNEWRLANDKVKRFMEQDEGNREKASCIDNSASDGMMDVMEEFTGLQVSGDAAAGRRLCTYLTAGAGKEYRSMDRMNRHYVVVAANSTSTRINTPQETQIVRFRPSVPVKTPLAQGLPAYLSFTPLEFNRLSIEEKRQWNQAHSRYMSALDQTAAGHKKEILFESQREAKPIRPGFELSSCQSAEATKRWLYRATGDDFEGEEEMMEFDAALKRPHAAGALTHTKWFTGDEL